MLSLMDSCGNLNIWDRSSNVFSTGKDRWDAEDVKWPSYLLQTAMLLATIMKQHTANQKPSLVYTLKG